MPKGPIRQFRTARAKSADANLKRFIDIAQANIPFVGVSWESTQWRIATKARASAGHRIVGLHFVRLRESRAHTVEALYEPFSSFCKAVACHREQLKVGGVSIQDHSTMVRACRYVYESLCVRSFSPTELLPADFDNAAGMALAREEQSTAYRVGCKLQLLSEVIDRYGLTSVPLTWVNSIRRPSSSGGIKQGRTGAEFDAERSSKMLSDAVLEALGQISNRSDLTDADLLRQRAVEVAFSTGFRANELLSLPRNVWVEDAKRDSLGRPVCGADGRVERRYGLRYWPEKGGHTETQVKWLPSVAVELVKRAIDDILRITDPWARVAKYIHEHLGKTLLGEPWDTLPAEYVMTFAEIAHAVELPSYKSSSAGARFVRTRKLPVSASTLQGRPFKWVCSKRDVEICLASLSRVGNVFGRGEAMQLVHESLFVVPKYFTSRRLALNGTAVLLTDGQLADYLGSRHSKSSIFIRLGYNDHNGQPLKVRPHQLRHWLNTLALEGGLPEHELARWMGRRDIRHNDAYDHVSGVQLARQVRQKMSDGNASGPISDYVASVRDPVHRKKTLASLVPTAHITDLGICMHDWTAVPCAQHEACANCWEHLIQKGNPVQKQRAIALRDQTVRLLSHAESEVQSGSLGANNWLLHHQRTLLRVKEIIEIHEDTTITDGTIIHLGDVKEKERNDEKSESSKEQ